MLLRWRSTVLLLNGKGTACGVQLERRGFLIPEDATSLCDQHANARRFVGDLELPPCVEGPPQSTERRVRFSLGEFQRTAGVGGKRIEQFASAALG